LEERLAFIFSSLSSVFAEFDIDEAAIEEVFVNNNGASSMKLCMARGVVMLVPSLNGKKVFEYGANCVKKTVAGSGHASKDEVKKMVGVLLPNIKNYTLGRSDSTDALAVALCHVMHRTISQLVS
jgi:crossover junction endodeoxyribonuclease RuvC